MSRVHTLEQVVACCGIDVRGSLAVQEERGQGNERENERDKMRESQGQRVIRLFSVRPWKLSSLGDEK